MMKYTQASLGRIFILRLEHGDKIPDIIEDFSREQEIESALVFFLGGADKGSKVIVGPQEGEAPRPVPMLKELTGVSESLAVGTLFVNEEEEPKLHMHSAFGREGNTITGCTREGVDVWQIGEVVVLEIKDTSACRRVKGKTGFELLEILQG